MRNAPPPLVEFFRKSGRVFAFTAVFLLIAVCLLSSPVVAGEIWAGDGTEENPYQISTVEELQALATAVNDGESFAGKYFKLMNDLDLFELCYGENNCNWNPIGIVIVSETDLTDWDERPFSGIFDGNGCRIYNMYINTNTWFQGLFGFTKDAAIQNLTVSGIITYENSAGGSGASYVGGLVGHSENCIVTDCDSRVRVDWAGDYVGGLIGSADQTTISECHTYDSILGIDDAGGLVGSAFETQISNCSAEGRVAGYRVGGLVGSVSSSTVSSSFALGDVQGSEKVGGLVGSIGSSIILNSYSTGNIGGNYYIGGLVGSVPSSLSRDQVLISNCYSTGDIHGSDSGGLIGGTNCGELEVISCYAVGDVSGSYNVGGLIGYLSAYNSIESCYRLETATVNEEIISDDDIRHGKAAPHDYLTDPEFLSVSLGWDFATVWTMDSTLSEYPVLKWQSKTNEDGEITEPVVDEDRFRLRILSVDGESLSSVDGKTISSSDKVVVLVDSRDILYSYESGGYTAVDLIITRPDGTTGNSFDGGYEYQSRYLFENTSILDTGITLSSGTYNVYAVYSSNSVSNPNLKTNTVTFTVVESTDPPLIGIDGDGTESSPYLISSAENLVQLSTAVGNGFDTNGVYFKVSESIDISSYKNWNPIGGMIRSSFTDTDTWNSDEYLYYNEIYVYSESTFNGIFDGNGKTISGLTINKPEDASETEGLFGRISGATIKNVTLTDVTILSSLGGGAVVGSAYDNSLIENCHVSGEFNYNGMFGGGIVGSSENSMISSCSANTEITVLASHIGAIAGRLIDSTIENCYAIGSINDTSDSYSYNSLGGLAGYSTSSTISKSYANVTIKGYGKHLGGLVGYDAAGNIIDCYSIGDINDTSENKMEVGGIVGYIDMYVRSSGSTFTNNYRLSTALVNGQTTNGETNDKNGKPVDYDSFNDEQKLAFFKERLQWTDFDTIWEMGVNGYPVLKTGISSDEPLEQSKTVIITPTTEGEYFTGNSLSVAWAYEGDISPDEFVVWLSRDGLQLGEWTTSSTSCEIPAKNLTQAGEYSIDVFPRNQIHDVDVWGNVKFTLKKSLEIISPQPSLSVSNDTDLMVSWSTEQFTPTGYKLSLRNITNGENGVLVYDHEDCELSTSFEIPANTLMADSRYRVAVCAYNDEVEIWEECEFTTVPTIPTEPSKLQEPTITYPNENSEHYAGNPITVTWTYEGDLIPDSYAVQLYYNMKYIDEWITTDKSFEIPAKHFTELGGTYSIDVYPKKDGYINNDICGNAAVHLKKNLAITSPELSQSIPVDEAFTVSWSTEQFNPTGYKLSLRNITHGDDGVLVYNHKDCGLATSFEIPANTFVSGNKYRVAVCAYNDDVEIWDEGEFVADCTHPTTSEVSAEYKGITENFPKDNGDGTHFWYVDKICDVCGEKVGREMKSENHNSVINEDVSVCECNYCPTDLQYVGTMYVKSDSITYLIPKVDSSYAGGSVDEGEEVSVFIAENFGTYNGWKLIEYSVDGTDRTKIRFVMDDVLINSLTCNHADVRETTSQIDGVSEEFPMDAEDGTHYWYISKCDVCGMTWDKPVECHVPHTLEKGGVCLCNYHDEIEITLGKLLYLKKEATTTYLSSNENNKGGVVRKSQLEDGKVSVIANNLGENKEWSLVKYIDCDLDREVIRFVKSSDLEDKFVLKYDTWYFSNTYNSFKSYLDKVSDKEYNVKSNDWEKTFGSNYGTYVGQILTDDLWGFANKGWGGCCAAMVAMIIGVEEDVFPVSGFILDGVESDYQYESTNLVPLFTTHKLANPTKAETLGQFLVQLQLFQLETEITDARFENGKDKYDEIINLVEEESITYISMRKKFMASSPDGREVGGTHAILGYKVDEISNFGDSSIIKLYVYDPNTPGREDQYIEFIRKNGKIVSWKYINSYAEAYGKESDQTFSSETHNLEYFTKDQVINTWINRYNSLDANSFKFKKDDELIYASSVMDGSVIELTNYNIEDAIELVVDADISDSEATRIYRIPKGDVQLASPDGGSAIITDTHSSIEVTLDKGASATLTVDDTQDNKIVIDSDSDTTNSFTVTYGYDESANKGYQSLTIQGTVADSFEGTATSEGIQTTGLTSAKVIVEDDTGKETVVQDISSLASYDEVTIEVKEKTVEVKGEANGVESVIASVPKEEQQQQNPTDTSTPPNSYHSSGSSTWISPTPTPTPDDEKKPDAEPTQTPVESTPTPTETPKSPIPVAGIMLGLFGAGLLLRRR